MGPTISDVNQKLAEKASRDALFRQLLDSDPKSAVAQTLSEVAGRTVQMPEGMKVTVHYNSPTDIHIALPYAQEGASLSDADLQSTGYSYSPTYIKCE